MDDVRDALFDAMREQFAEDDAARQLHADQVLSAKARLFDANAAHPDSPGEAWMAWWSDPGNTIGNWDRAHGITHYLGANGYPYMTVDEYKHKQITEAERQWADDQARAPWAASDWGRSA